MGRAPRFRWTIALAALALTSACVAPSNPPPRTGAGTASVPSGAFRAAPTMRGFGIDTVVGKEAPDLLRRFGNARIDLSEGDARKLQFVSARCVLDVFLYPRTAGAAPVASYVEARELGSGADTDRAICIADIARERGGR